MLIFEDYEGHERHLPATGRFIIAQFDKNNIIVYQAFKDSIAEYALSHQRFGGSDYDFARTTWLKPSFLWMMYYSGWAKNENQENVLAIHMRKHHFDHLLEHAALTNPESQLKKEMEEVQLQWVSYHDIWGNKTDRKAAKIGLSGNMLRRFNEEWILQIEDVTPFVKQQQDLVKANSVELLRVPVERVYAPAQLGILPKIDATNISL